MSSSPEIRYIFTLLTFHNVVCCNELNSYLKGKQGNHFSFTILKYLICPKSIKVPLFFRTFNVLVTWNYNYNQSLRTFTSWYLNFNHTPIKSNIFYAIVTLSFLTVINYLIFSFKKEFSLHLIYKWIIKLTS